MPTEKKVKYFLSPNPQHFKGLVHPKPKKGLVEVPLILAHTQTYWVPYYNNERNHFVRRRSSHFNAVDTWEIKSPISGFSRAELKLQPSELYEYCMIGEGKIGYVGRKLYLRLYPLEFLAITYKDSVLGMEYTLKSCRYGTYIEAESLTGNHSEEELALLLRDTMWYISGSNSKKKEKRSFCQILLEEEGEGEYL